MPENQEPISENIQKLLQPTSDHPPCGEDLWMTEGRYRLQQPLDEAVRGGAEPQWPAIRDDATELITRSHDLRTAVLLCLALFKTEGLPGFRDGLVLIHGLIENFWDNLHPVPEDPADPIRSNILSNLAAPPGSRTPYQFVKLLRETPLCQSAAGITYSLADIDRAESNKPPEDPDAPVPPSREQIDSAFAVSRDKFRETEALVAEIASQIKAIEALASSKLAAAAQLDFAKLEETLGRMAGELKDPNAEGIKTDAVSQTTSGSPGAMPGSGFAAGGVIRSRADAEAALTAICDYFRRCEPSSPVPLLIERARKLLKLDFMASVRELAPNTLEQFHPLFGTKEPEKTDNPSG